MAETTPQEIEEYNAAYRAGLRMGRQTKDAAPPVSAEDDALEMIGREIVQVIRADVARTLAQNREQITALKQRIDELETMVLELTERK